MPRRERDSYKPTRSNKNAAASTRSTRSGRAPQRGNLYVEITPDNRASCVTCHERLKKGLIRVGTLGNVLVNDRWKKEMVSWCHLKCFPVQSRPKDVSALYGHEKLDDDTKTEIMTTWAADS